MALLGSMEAGSSSPARHLQLRHPSLASSCTVHAAALPPAIMQGSALRGSCERLSRCLKGPTKYYLRCPYSLHSPATSLQSFPVHQRRHKNGQRRVQRLLLLQMRAHSGYRAGPSPEQQPQDQNSERRLQVQELYAKMRKQFPKASRTPLCFARESACMFGFSASACGQ